MKDLKQIQEFFSKPLNEDTFKVGQKVTYLGHPAVVTATKEYNGRNFVSVSYDKGTGKTKASDILTTSGDIKPLNENVHVEAFKLGKALKGMGYDVKVKAVDDFGKNVFEIYFNNPADADDDSIFYDVKKLGYDNVRVFANPQESLTENGDPIIVKYFKPGDEYFQILVKYEKPVGFTTALGSRTALGQQNDQNEAAAQKRVKTIVNNLKANFNLDEIFVEKGQVAGRYYINAFSDDFVDIDADYLKNNLSEASKEEETEFHKKLDTLVHDTFGKRKGELEEAYVPSNIAEFAKRRGVSSLVRKVAGWAEKVGARITGGTAIGKGYNTLILDMGYQTADIRIDVEDETIELYDEPIYSFNDFKRVFMEEESRKQAEHDEETLRREQGLDEYNTGIYYKDEKTQDKTKEASKSALEKVKDMIQKVLKEEEGYSKFLKTDDNPEGKTKGLDTATMNKILMNVIKDIEETKRLGEGMIEEELCPKGKAYIKKRQAAGEKSSAYLSGRAVKVCKGQMKG
jgi:hypothetical protein